MWKCLKPGWMGFGTTWGQWKVSQPVVGDGTGWAFGSQTILGFIKIWGIPSWAGACPSSGVPVLVEGQCWCLKNFTLGQIWVETASEFLKEVSENAVEIVKIQAGEGNGALRSCLAASQESVGIKTLFFWWRCCKKNKNDEAFQNILELSSWYKNFFSLHNGWDAHTSPPRSVKPAGISADVLV